QTVIGGPKLWTWNAVFSDVGTDHDWASVSAGDQMQCAIKTDGSLWCWGNNRWGSVGDGTTTDSTVPVHIAPGTHWAEVSTSGLFTCGIQTDGSLWCWGNGAYGQLGLGVPVIPHKVPTRVGTATDWQHVTTGLGGFACGIRSGALWCWGRNTGPGYVKW